MATAAPPPQPTTDPKAFYGYVFQPNNDPTPVFRAFLLAVTKYIIDNIGDKDDKTLSPTKLAAFYRAVGGNCDALFLEVPHQSISYIWQITGCQHTLQPTADDYAQPSIPALTGKGFVRWQSVQTLLSPEVHVPLLQFIAKNWALVHPDTGEPFPPDLPKECLPSEPDAGVTKWHEQCGERLRREAENAAEEDTPSSRPATAARPHFKDSAYYYPRPRPAPTGSRGPSPHAPPDGAVPTFSFTHAVPRYVPATTAAGVAAAAAASASFATAAAAARWAHRVRLSPPPAERENRGRRRSFSDYPSPQGSAHEPMTKLNSASHLGAANLKPVHPRRHSHPHNRMSSSSSSSADEFPSMHPRTARRGVGRLDDAPPLSSVRHVRPPTHSGGIPTVLPDTTLPRPLPGKRESSSSGADRRRGEELPIRRSPRRSPHRSPHRVDEPRRKSLGVAGDLREKLSSFLPNGIVGVVTGKTERPRSTSQSSRSSPSSRPHPAATHGMGSVPLRHSKESLQGSRLGHSWSYDSEDDNASEVERVRVARALRERERERDRVEREREDGREYRSRRERDRGRERERERDRGRLERSDHSRGDRSDRRSRDRDREVDRRSRDRERVDLNRDRYESLHDRDRAKNKSRSLDRGLDRSLDRGSLNRARGRESGEPEDGHEYRGRHEREREMRDRDKVREQRDRERYAVRVEPPYKKPSSLVDLPREW